MFNTIRFNHVQQTLDHLRRSVARLLTALLVSLCVVVNGTAAKDLRSADSGRALSRIEREVRHELVMLPFYGVFDNLSFRVNGGTVTLMGQVSRPTLKTDAERVVKGIEGVDRVVNKVEVLPLSSYDDEIRLASYRAIYGHTALNRYALQAVPPIHIVVKNGNVTLEGVVANEGDKNIAGLQANTVPGVFSVTNSLRVERQG